jgi:hypothetical protein
MAGTPNPLILSFASHSPIARFPNDLLSTIKSTGFSRMRLRASRSELVDSVILKSEIRQIELRVPPLRLAAYRKLGWFQWVKNVGLLLGGCRVQRTTCFLVSVHKTIPARASRFAEDMTVRTIAY